MSISEIKKIVNSNEWLMTIPASTSEAKIDIVMNKAHLMSKVDLMRRWGWSRGRVKWLLDKFPSRKKENKAKEISSPIKSFRTTYGLEHIIKTKISENDYNKLIERYGMGIVHKKIISLEGSVHVNKKVDHYATLVNWIQREKESGRAKTSFKDQAHVDFHRAINESEAN